MYGKSNMETYITTCEIDSQQEFVVWLRKLKHGLCINDSMDTSLAKLRKLMINREAWHAEVDGVTKSWLRLSDWTD